MDVRETGQGSQFDDGLRFPLEEHRQDHDLARRRVPQTGGNVNVVVRHFGEHQPLLLQGTLAYQGLAQPPLSGELLALLISVAAQQA